MGLTAPARAQEVEVEPLDPDVEIEGPDVEIEGPTAADDDVDIYVEDGDVDVHVDEQPDLYAQAEPEADLYAQGGSVGARVETAPPVAAPDAYTYQPAVEPQPVEAPNVVRGHVFLEATGAGGVQLGDTSYLPSSSSTDFQFPLVYSFGVGGTAGVMLGDNVAFIVNYQYSRGQTRDGSVPGVLENVEGRIDYHTTLAGIRLWVPVGFGALRADVSAGIVFPHSEVLQFDYGPALTQLPTPITGTGTMVENFSVGYGGQGRIGYQLPLFGPLYLATDLAVEVYQSENSGETTELTNFVPDLAATPPTAVTATILHADGAERPNTRAVASGRLQLSLGAMF